MVPLLGQSALNPKRVCDSQPKFSARRICSSRPSLSPHVRGGPVSLFVVFLGFAWLLLGLGAGVFLLLLVFLTIFSGFLFLSIFLCLTIFFLCASLGVGIDLLFFALLFRTVFAFATFGFLTFLCHRLGSKVGGPFTRQLAQDMVRQDKFQPRCMAFRATNCNDFGAAGKASFAKFPLCGGQIHYCCSAVASNQLLVQLTGRNAGAEDGFFVLSNGLGVDLWQGYAALLSKEFNFVLPAIARHARLDEKTD